MEVLPVQGSRALLLKIFQSRKTWLGGSLCVLLSATLAFLWIYTTPQNDILDYVAWAPDNTSVAHAWHRPPVSWIPERYPTPQSLRFLDTELLSSLSWSPLKHLPLLAPLPPAQDHHHLLLLLCLTYGGPIL